VQQLNPTELFTSAAVLRELLISSAVAVNTMHSVFGEKVYISFLNTTSHIFAAESFIKFVRNMRNVRYGKTDVSFFSEHGVFQQNDIHSLNKYIS